ncbi:MAG TPA: pantoate--beta-alanine ligase [Verrucomicrobiae bacterium]|nr:pantoate--beta-alanine ligase [Verrucomicrobiae bacterium]
MKIISSAAAMQRLAQKWRRAGVKIAFVPTMGCLHDGHVSLMRVARQRVGKSGKVVVSIYVNPTQFAPTEDWAKYPRDLEGDAQRCRRADVDVVFAPADAEMYPGGAEDRFSTCVVEETLSRPMEGVSRPTHFRGVTTVVAKLFNLVQPHVAVFGEKDFQQAAIIRRMVRDLNFPVRILVAPTVREPDGLAMSSRNQYLSPEQRRQATVLWRAIQSAQAAVKKSRSIAADKLKADLRRLIEAERDARLDYVEFFEPETLRPVATVTHGTHLALAVFIGSTRLIDHASL